MNKKYDREIMSTCRIKLLKKIEQVTYCACKWFNRITQTTCFIREWLHQGKVINKYRVGQIDDFKVLQNVREKKASYIYLLSIEIDVRYN